MQPGPVEIVAIIAIPLVFFGIISVLVYLDATKNDVSQPEKWALVVIISGGVMLFVYLSERGDDNNNQERTGPSTLPGSSEDDETK